MDQVQALFFEWWPMGLAGLVALVMIIGMLKGWATPGGTLAWLYWMILYLGVPSLYLVGYMTKNLHRKPRFLMEDPSAVNVGGLTPLVMLGIAIVAALFIAGGSEKAPLWRLMSYLGVSFIWVIAGTVTMTHVFDTRGLMMWALIPTAFNYAAAAVAIFTVARNAWQRSPMEQHRSS